jgi:hypothetical protein
MAVVSICGDDPFGSSLCIIDRPAPVAPVLTQATGLIQQGQHWQQAYEQTSVNVSFWLPHGLAEPEPFRPELKHFEQSASRKSENQGSQHNARLSLPVFDCITEADPTRNGEGKGRYSNRVAIRSLFAGA